MKSKILELRNASLDELSAREVSLKKELFNLRVKKASGQEIKDMALLRRTRKDVARVKTFISANKNASQGGKK